jgi:hypothetical protein
MGSIVSKIYKSIRKQRPTVLSPKARKVVLDFDIENYQTDDRWCRDIRKQLNVLRGKIT